MFLSLYVCFTLIFLVFCSSVCPNLFLRLSLETLLYPFLIFSVCLCFFTCGFLSGITNTEVEVERFGKDHIESRICLVFLFSGLPLGLSLLL